MSDNYFATRLRWEGRSGIAKLHGHTVKLDGVPALPGIDLAIVALDYVPEIGMHQIMPLAEGWRDMTHGEIHAADQFLWDTAAV